MLLKQFSDSFLKEKYNEETNILYRMIDFEININIF